MQHTNLWTAVWLWANQSIKRQLSNSKNLRIAAVLSLLAIALVTLTLSRQMTTTAQAQQAVQVPDSASLFEANAAAANSTKEQVIEQPDIKAEGPAEESVIQGGAGCGWTTAPVYPITVLDNAVTSVGNNLYSFAGVSTAIIATSYKFDGTTWTPIAPLPVALEKPVAVSDGTSAYIIGGVNAAGTSVNTLYRYNPATNDYTTLAPSTTAVWTPAATFLNGKIYKIGGYVSSGGTTTATNAVEIYDIASNSWTAGATYPQSLGWIAAFTQNNLVYTAGGTGVAAGTDSAKTYQYTPATNTWDDAAIADLPATRWGSAVANYNGGTVLAGGYVATVISDTVVEWRATNNTWVTLPNLIAGARGRVAGGIANGAFHVIGGRSVASSGFVGTNDNQRLFCPPANAPFIIGNVTYVSENGTPANNTPDPGETVTVSLNLQNLGGVNTGANVTATLQATGGIVPVTTSQNYGVLTAGAAATSRNFTFTVPASATCGSQITLTFIVQDGTTSYTITQTYTLGVLQNVFSENFDSVTAPALPAGWTQVATGSNTGWVTTTTNPDSAPNSAFAPDLATPGGADLTSPVINGILATSKLNFRINYNTEATWDGGILEIKIGAGAFQELTAAGGTFASGGYNSGVRGTGNPLGTQPGWSGNSNGYVSVSVNLPAAAVGQAVQFRWRVGNDDSIAPAGGGINIDNVAVTGNFVCSTTAPTNTRIDFDADGKTDVSVFRSGVWYVQRSTSGFTAANFGAAGDQLVPADYDGDGRTDYAVFRPTATVGTADFFVLNSGTNTLGGAEWGTTGDVAKPGNFTGDNRADFAVYRPSNNTWYIYPREGGTGIITTIAGTSNTFAPIVLDYDGDGKSDIAQVSNGNWFIRRSGAGTIANVFFGQAGDRFVPADYDNDNRDDLAVFRNGVWYALRSSTSTVVYIYFGQAGDIPVPGDYDGDGADDQAVYRNGIWYINRSSSGVQIVNFGISTDTPVPSVYVQ